MSKRQIIRGILSMFEDNVVSGPGLNLIRAVKEQVRLGNLKEAEAILKRAALNGKFAGNFEAQELSALRLATGSISKKVAMPAKEYTALSKEAVKTPLILGAGNFPVRMARQGFVPLTGVNINKPSLTMKEFTGRTRSRFIDQGAQNLMAAWNMDPVAAEAYASFYPRAYDQLVETGIPLERVGGAWATLSAQADPDMNAELLKRILRNPTELTTTRRNQETALRFLAGEIDDPSSALGFGKRFNFMQNSIRPDDPRFLTADTRYAQNLQGILNAYSRAPFAGMFQPRGGRYQSIYVTPGIEAAERIGRSPSGLQAGAWGNWRNRMSGIETDLSGDLLSDIAGFNYDPAVYSEALRIIGG